MNEIFLYPYTEEEVKIALFQMPPSKAPGPDGMSALFFQQYWHLLGSKITRAVLDCISSRRMLRSVNYTHIVLIPKVANPDCMSQFRPISLCNVAVQTDFKGSCKQVKRGYCLMLSPIVKVLLCKVA